MPTLYFRLYLCDFVTLLSHTVNNVHFMASQAPSFCCLTHPDRENSSLKGDTMIISTMVNSFLHLMSFLLQPQQHCGLLMNMSYSEGHDIFLTHIKQLTNPDRAEQLINQSTRSVLRS